MTGTPPLDSTKGTDAAKAVFSIEALLAEIDFKRAVGQDSQIIPLLKEIISLASCLHSANVRQISQTTWDFIHDHGEDLALIHHQIRLDHYIKSLQHAVINLSSAPLQEK